jgi:hypothetical protein
MFERNRVDSTPQPTFVPVEITLEDGAIMKGKLAVPIGRTTVDAINGDGRFIQFEPYGADSKFLSKQHILEIRLIGIPVANVLQPRVRSHDEFNPHAILGLSDSATWDEVRQAYVQLSKTYHPDRYSTAVLPEEVRTYLETMARRINSAYAALDTTHRVVKTNTGLRSAPVFTSGPRA